MGQTDHLLDGIHRGKRIRDVSHSHNLRASLQLFLVGLQVEHAVVIHRNHQQFSAMTLNHLLPRDEVGMVLHGCNQDLFRRQQIAQGSRQQIQRLGSASREDDFVGFRSVDKPSYSLAGVFVRLGGHLTEIMHPTMDIAVLVQVIVAFPLNHT